MKYIGLTFPDTWLWRHYEEQCVDSLLRQIQRKFKAQRNLVINTTWFGPQFTNYAWQEFEKLNETFDNLFLLATVDPAMITDATISQMVAKLGNPTVYKIGNFDTEYHYNFFAPVLADCFKKYSNNELLLHRPKWLFCNYNRKPRQHRVNFVKCLIESDLMQYGVVTLGKPNQVYDHSDDNNLYFNIGERIEDYQQYGHWYNGEDTFGIPHDVLSLHNMTVWQQHFLNIIGATEFYPWDDIFVSETQWKPIIGLRPFLINGNVRTYQWLRDNGFRTFNHYFPGIEFENITEDEVHQSIVQAIQYLTTLTADQLMQLYTDMLPDLLHNQSRFYIYAEEQRLFKDRLFK